jgi:iron complex transport system substrate-binding protein
MGRIGKRVRIPRGRATVMRRLIQHFFKPGDLPKTLCSFERFAERRSGRTDTSITPSPDDCLFPFAKSGGRRDFLHLYHSKTKQIACALVLLCAGIVLLSCSRQRPSESSVSTQTREVVDEAGRKVTLPAKIERVISLAPNLTEIIYAVGGGDRLVGDTTFCNYPPQAKNVAKVGDTLQPSIERILALRPQLVLVSTASQLEAFTTQLNEQQIAVYITDPRDLEGVFRSILNVGDLLNESVAAAELVKQLRARTETVARAVAGRPPVSVFFQLSGQPLYTAGKNSFVTNLIERAGGRSVTANVNEAWPRLSDEAALASRPETIIMLSGAMGATANTNVAPALRNSPAVQTGRVYVIDGDLLTRPGPRLVDGLEQIARALHPEAFR